MVRQPVWTNRDEQVVYLVLRRLRMPLLCIDLCLAMAADSKWSIQALGTEEWNIPEKICGNYSYGTNLIEKNLKAKTSAEAQMVGMRSSRAAEPPQPPQPDSGSVA